MQKQLSIKAAFEEKERLEQEAKTVWHGLADELVKLIPNSMQRFAKEIGWIKNEIDFWWQLPRFLENLVNHTRMGFRNSERYNEDVLVSLGFKNFEDLKAGFRELEQAWKRLIRIEFQDRGRQIRVYFYAAEIMSERKS